MKEIEIKARVSDRAGMERRLGRICGCEGGPVAKDDLYFRRPGEILQALRMRNNSGVLEFTAKETVKEGGFENNFEREFSTSIDQWEKAKAFFLTLGYVVHFEKRKRGLEWTYDGVHIELLEVNDLGAFLEMEILAPEDIDEEGIREAREKLYSLLHEAGLEDGDVEMRSYRSMILGEEWE